MAYDIELGMEHSEPVVRVTDRDSGLAVLQFRPRAPSYVRFCTPEGECPYRRLTQFLIRDFFLMQVSAEPHCLSCQICLRPVAGAVARIGFGESRTHLR